jgi:hypothetical protein
MSKADPQHSTARETTRSVVVSKDGAAVRVEKIEISDRTRRGLTANVESIGPPSGQYTQRNGRHPR